MGSAVPAATTALVTKAQTALASYTFEGHLVTVVDGPPENPTSPTLCVGLSDPPDRGENPNSGTQASREWFALGAAETLEDFLIPCYIDVIKPGTAEATAATRQAASDILDLFWAQIRADPSLGGLVSGLARIPSVEFVPFGVVRGSQQGRRTIARFSVRCINEYVT